MKNFSIKGTFLNASNVKTYFQFQDFTVSLITGKEGSFQYSAKKLVYPPLAYLKAGDRLSIPLYVASGYELNNNADTKDRDTFFKTMKMEVVGSATNKL